jgi:hypothetical protein
VRSARRTLQPKGSSRGFLGGDDNLIAASDNIGDSRNSNIDGGVTMARTIGHLVKLLNG